MANISFGRANISFGRDTLFSTREMQANGGFFCLFLEMIDQLLTKEGASVKRLLVLIESGKLNLFFKP